MQDAPRAGFFCLCLSQSGRLAELAPPSLCIVLSDPATYNSALISDRGIPLPRHVPVMLDEVMEWLAPQPGRFIVDGTLGGGGHAQELARRVAPNGRVLALDRDPEAVASAAIRLSNLPVRVAVASYCDLSDVLAELQFPPADGIVLDLGLSSDQLDDPRRGFSFEQPGPLDLRFNPNEGEPAWQLLQRWDAKRIADAIFQFGEERFSRRIARAIVAERERRPIRMAAELAELVASCVPRSRDSRRIHPATRTFQALRIAVNGELDHLEQGLKRLPDCLRVGAVAAVISFHSLEDRLVKQAFRGDPRWQPLAKKPLIPSDAEVERNPRARSAKLRVARRTE